MYNSIFKFLNNIPDFTPLFKIALSLAIKKSTFVLKSTK